MGNKLNVIDVRQWGQDADLRITDCGLACLLALLRWKGIAGTLTVDDLTRLSALMSKDIGLTCGQIAAVGRLFGLDMRVVSALTIQQIKGFVDQGQGAILLILYGDDPRRQDVNDKFGGHFLIADGYDDNGNLLVDDPDILFNVGSWGQDVIVAERDIDKALSDISDPIVGKRAGIVCYGLLANSVDHIAESIVDGLHVRAAANLNAQILTSINKGDQVKASPIPMIDHDGHEWIECFVPFKGATITGWIANDLLETVAAPVGEQPIGYDISHYNAWTTLPPSDFIMHKCSEGTMFTDSAYAARKAAYKGLWGAYHFGTGGDVAKQVALFLKTAQPDGKTVLVLDFEPNPDVSDTSEGNMSLSQAADFVTAIHEKTGVYPVLYTRANLIGNVPPDLIRVFYSCPLWIASEQTPPTVPAGWLMIWTFQQYGQVDVDGAKIDADRFNGSLDDLKAFWAANAAKSPVVITPDPTPVPVLAPDFANVIAPDGVNLRVAPIVTSKRLEGVPFGSTVNRTGIYTIDATGMKWAQSIYGGVEGYIDNEFLRAGHPVIVVPPVAQAPSRLIGPHLMGTISEAELTEVQTYGIMKFMDKDDLIDQMHTANPNATHIWRSYDYHHQWEGADDFINKAGGVGAAVDKWIADLRSRFKPWLYHESFNESGHSQQYLAFEELRNRKMAALGYKCVLLNSAVATMNANDWARARGMVASAIVTGALIGVHCYAQTVMSADYAGSGFDASGVWHGDLFPTVLDMDNAWTGLRVFRDIRDLTAQGQGSARFVITELGLDDLNGSVHYPKQGKTKGWKTCVDTWRANGWLNNITPEAFYRQQLNWWAGMVARFPQIVGGTLYTYGDTPDWKDFDGRGVL